MEEWVEIFAARLAILIEGIAALVIGLGVLEGILTGLRSRWKQSTQSFSHATRLRLGRWLSIALELLLAADILQTAIAPTWDEIGKLAAIATLRTALNYFLEREIRVATVGGEIEATEVVEGQKVS